MTLYLVIVKENLSWLILFLVITAGTIACRVLENLQLISRTTFVVIAITAFVPWIVSLLAFLIDATSRDSEGKKLTIDD